MDAPKLNPQDSLKVSFPKLNQSIDNANEALNRVANAENDSAEAKEIAEQTQSEFRQAVLEGDSSPLAGMLSVGADGTMYEDGPQERLVSEYNRVIEKFANTEEQIKVLYGKEVYVDSYKSQIPEADDYGKVLRAVTDIQEAGKGVLIFSKNKLYTFGKIELPSNILVFYKGAELINRSGNNDSLFYASNKENIFLDGISIDGNGSNNIGTPIQSGLVLFENCNNITVMDTYIHDSFSSALRFNNCTNIRVFTSVFKDTHGGFSEHALLYIKDCNDIMLLGNTYDGSQSNGMKITASVGKYSENALISSCTSKNNYYIGIACGRLKNSTINGNNCYNNGDNGIDENGGFGVNISGNTCNNNGKEDNDGSGFPQGDGIYYGENGSQKITITGNTCTGNTRAGIGNVADSDHATITGNTLTKNKIGLQKANGLYWSISSNIILENTEAGIYLTTVNSSGQDTTIARGILNGNNLYGNGVPVKLSVEGRGNFTDNQISNNRGIDWSTILFVSTIGTQLNGEQGFYTGIKALNTRDDFKFNIPPIIVVPLVQGQDWIGVPFPNDIGRTTYEAWAITSYGAYGYYSDINKNTNDMVMRLSASPPDNNQVLRVFIIG